MKNGSKEDYLLLEKHEKKFIEGTADRILKFMGGLNSTLEGYKVSRLEHSLQTATRALNDKTDDEMIDYYDCLTRNKDILDEIENECKKHLSNPSDYLFFLKDFYENEKWTAYDE